MSHTHPVLDSDEHFVINPETRAITNSSSSKITLMQYDHNSERFSFEIPKLVENHDMSLCNSIEIHFTNTSQNRTLENSDVYVVDDMVPSRDDANVLVLTWLISEKATQLAGFLNFQIKFACVEGDRVVYRWNTDVNNTVIVKNSMSSSDSIEEDYSDAITSLISKVSAALSKNGFHAVSRDELMELGSNSKLVVGDIYFVTSDSTIGPANQKGAIFVADSENSLIGKGRIEDGFSPAAKVEATEMGTKITITDKNGTTIETVENGEDGTSVFAVGDSEFAAMEEYRLFHTGDIYIITDGVRRGDVYLATSPESGQLQGNICGADGFSPTAKVEETAEGAKITIADKNGTTTVTVKNGGGGGASAWLSNVTLLASKWIGSDSLYSQVVTINGITPYSKVDLLPSVEQLAIFHNKDVAFVTENEDGVVTVFAIGDKPTQDYTMQASITEVTV